MAAVVQAGRPSGGGHLARADAAVEAAGEDRGSERLQVRLARRSAVERLEPLGRIEQQRRSVAAAAEREHDLGAQASEPGALEVVQRAHLRHRQKLVRGLQRPRLELGLGRGQRPPTTTGRVRRQLGRSLEERGGGGDAAASPRAPGRALQLVGDGLVETRCRVRAMPGAPIGIDVGIGRLGQRPMHLLAVEHGRRLVDRRAHQRVAEPHMCTELDQSRRLRRRRRVGSEPEPARPPATAAPRLPPARLLPSAAAVESRPEATRAVAGSSARSGSPAAPRREARTRPPARPESDPAAARGARAGSRATRR